MDNTLTQIGKYTLIKQLGSGGFGAVYLAEDPKLHQQVAIKVFQLKDAAIAQQATSSSTDAIGVLKQRFLEEARILRQLSLNPNIIDVYDFDELPDGTPYYVMPYLPQSLKDELGSDATDVSVIADLAASDKPRALPVSRVTDYLLQILQALAEVHKAGLVHRDIKPANLLLTAQGKVQLCDFGIAKLPDTGHSQTGVGMGSRNYMSPEQRQSAKHVDARSDIYSIGVLAYRMLTGTLPEGRFAEPAHYAPQITPAFNQWVLQALEQQKERRFTDASEMLMRLKQAISSQANQSADDATATFVGQSSAGLKAELQPLKAKITELLKQEGLLSDKSQQQLQVLADIADISESELKALIQQTEQELAGEIGAFKKWRQGLEKQLAANNGQLTAELKATLLQAGLALGKTEAELVPFLGSATFTGKATSKAAGSGPTERKALPLKPVAAIVIIALLGFGGWQFNSYSNQQAALKQQDEQAWQQAKTSHTEQSYRQYLTSQANGNYRLSAEQQLSKLKDEGEANAQLAADQKRKQQNTRSQQISTAQDWLIKHDYTLTKTGELDARTKAAIEAFEKAEKLLVTGEVDPTLLSKLEESYWRKDKAAFDAAKKANTEQGYNIYLSAWQDGKYRTEAEQGIANVKAAIAKAKKEAEEQAKQDAIAKAAAEEKAAEEKVRRDAEELKASTLRLIGKMASIPAGSFTMGCSSGDTDCQNNEKPTRQVTVSAFKLMETEVTFAMWDACAAAGGCSHKPDDKGWGRGNRPVINVSYNDITKQFIPWLNKTTGQAFRLPSEAEWEYAARAGSNTKYSWGNDIGRNNANCHGCGTRWDNKQTAPVKSFRHNAFGLYDMHGNVWEWTQDCWKESYSFSSSNDCGQRVLRGGSWYFFGGDLRVSGRARHGISFQDQDNGFRLAQGEQR